MTYMTMKRITKREIDDFLWESNAIEGVCDKESFLQARQAWEFLMTKKKLTVPVILKVHKILSQNSHLLPTEQGFFRKVPVWVGGREGLRWDLIPAAMDSWIGDVETSLKIPGADGENIKIDHITVEHIHPFCDFNGRTFRHVMNWERVQVGLPLLIIHADWPDEDGDQRKYYSWFR